MNELNLVYESQGINNYVCVKVTDSLSRFQVKMLENNEIPGLLAMHGTIMNGICKLHYDITKMQRLSDVLRDGLAGQEARKLLLDLLTALVGTEDYLLSMTRCVLHPDYIFVKSGNKVGVVYLPFEEREVLSVDDVRMFYQNILAEYLTDDDDIYFLNLLKYVNKQDFSLAGLMEKLEAGVESKKEQQSSVVQNQVEQGGWKQPESQENTMGEGSFGKIPFSSFKKEESKKAETKKPFFEFASKKEKEDKKVEEKPAKKPPEKKPGADLSSLGFVVPGMENAATSEPKNEVVKKEKKSGLFGELFGGGKKSAGQEVKILETASSKKTEQPKGFFSKQETKESSHSTTEFEENNGAWKGTVILGTESTATVIIGTQAMPQLIHAGSSVAITHFPFRIGNGKVEVDYAIPKGVISRNHASIQCSQGRYYVKDENSANHTYVNGRMLPPFTEIELHSGDVIRLANEEVTFQM